MVIMMISKRGKLFTQCLVMFAILLMASVSLASVQATLDRSKIYEGESFTLTISSDGSQRTMPDLSLLEKDFHILGSGSSQQMQVINGVVSSKTSWNIQLQAKATGQFHIPSLRVGKELTNPIQVIVSAPPEVSADSSGQPVFIEVETSSPDNPVYLQQQILYTVRLVFARPLLDGSLSTPTPENALVEQLGEDNQYQVRRGGRSYKVIERRYAIFPEKSGQLLIPPIRFSGRLASSPAERRRPGKADPWLDPQMKRFFGGDPFSGSGFDSFFDQGKPVSLQSKAISLDVLPRPESYITSHWLPAASLELEDNWAEQPPEFKVGEPVSRTISIKAKGLLATLLPKLDIADIDGVSIYPEQPVTETRTDGSWVYGQSKQSMSYMPTKAGTLVIPELQLSWWDTLAGVQRTAVLPKWTVDVLPGKDLPAEPVVPVEARDAVDELPETAAAKGKESSDTLQEMTWTRQIQEYWQWLLALLMTVILAVFWLRRNIPGKRPGRVEQATGTQEMSAAHKQTQRELKQRLQKACSENDASSTAETLLKMAAIAHPENPPKTLPALAAMLESGSEEIYSLDRLPYATGDAEWNGDDFCKNFKSGLVFRVNKKPVHEGLAPLYPD